MGETPRWLDCLILPAAALAQDGARTRKLGILVNLDSDDEEGKARIKAFTQELDRSRWTREAICTQKFAGPARARSVIANTRRASICKIDPPSTSFVLVDGEVDTFRKYNLRQGNHSTVVGTPVRELESSLFGGSKRQAGRSEMNRSRTYRGYGKIDAKT
jgi:hypothetical protein